MKGAELLMLIPRTDEVAANGRYSKPLAIQDTLSGVWVKCKFCGSRERVNPRLVGKARKIERCRECL